jgi:hypothetical protein
MGRSVASAITGVIWLAGVSAGAASAADSPGEMAANISQLVEPARHVDIRLDAVVATTIPRRGARAGLDLEIGTRPDFWYGIGVASASTSEVTEIDTATSRTVITTDGALVFSARLFKRIGPAVFSGGLIDSRPAVEAELRGWRDRARLEVVVADHQPMRLSDPPSVRAGGSLQWGWFYVQAGVQDLFTPDLRATYLGLGMRWHDLDLRDLLPWVAAR